MATWDSIKTIAFDITGDFKCSGISGTTGKALVKTGSSSQAFGNLPVGGIQTGSNSQVITTVGGATVWQTPLLLFNSSGAVIPKIWYGSANTASGVATFNISSAGFTTITNIQATVESNGAASTQTWAVVTASSTTSVSVTVYNIVFTGTSILGIPVIGTVNQQIYTATTKGIHLQVTGS